MKPFVAIGPHFVGEDYPPFIVAEVGINHNGDLEKALEMIRVAKDSGATAVKFQTFKAEEFITDKKQMFTYESQGAKVTESMLDMFSRYEFDTDQWHKIKKKCDEIGILFFSTPQNRSDLDLLLELGIPAIKIGSDDFINIPLLKDYASTKLPLIVSSGMADLGEVFQSLEAVGALDNYPTILLHCVSEYPCPPKNVNLRKISSLKSSFPMIPIGFSDHTEGPLASSLAVAFGACFFEKHFTLDNNLPGPDHWFSVNPVGLNAWVDGIKTATLMLGSSLVRPTQDEKEKMRGLARRSVVALNDINADETLSAKNIGLRRPGDGLAPYFFDKILGTKANKFIPKGSKLHLGDFYR